MRFTRVSGRASWQSRSRMRTSLSLAALVCAISFPSLVRADALPIGRDVQLGRPARARALRVEVRAAALRVRIDATELTLPLESATEASVEEVALAGGAAVIVVRARDAGREIAALIAHPGGRARLLWSGRTDLHGDPGERRADVVEIADRTGDGAPDVIVAGVAEGARICGVERTLLFPRAIDPQSQTLRPVVLFQLPTSGAQQEVVATRTTPGPAGAPLVAGLRFVGASSQEGAGEELSAVSAPRTLETPDGGYWAEGRGGSGRGEFVTARRETSGFAIRALAITPSPADAVAARLGRPKVLWLVGDGGARVRVTLPEDAALHPGQRYWVVPREPLAWSCVSVLLDEAYLPAGTPAAATRTALAGVELYTELDFGGGVEQLVRALIGDGADAGAAADLLARLGAAATTPTRAAWPRMSASGRRRAVRVFAASARMSDAAGDEARAALVVAGSDDDAEVRAAAITALAQAGAPAVAALGGVLRAGGDAGDAAALALAAAGADAVAPILAAISSDGGTERPVLRDALAAASRAGGAPARSAVTSWLEATPAVESRASVALALSTVPEAAALVRRIVADSAADATDFIPRYRLIHAAHVADAAPADAITAPVAAAVPAPVAAPDAAPAASTDDWLALIAHDAPEWMLRAAALEALDARRSPKLTETARVALDDAYPRVRIAGMHALRTSSADLERVSVMARRDPWPMVRSEAVLQLAPQRRARDVIRAALDDAKESVRAAAVVAITRAGDRAAWPLVAARLADDDEWPIVISAGLELARALCSQDAHDAVMAVLQRGLRDDAWAPDAEMAVLALETAVMIGGALADDARQVAERSSAPESLRGAARRLRERSAAACTAAR